MSRAKGKSHRRGSQDTQKEQLTKAQQHLFKLKKKKSSKCGKRRDFLCCEDPLGIHFSVRGWHLPSNPGQDKGLSPLCTSTLKCKTSKPEKMKPLSADGTILYVGNTKENPLRKSRKVQLLARMTITIQKSGFS